MSVPRPFFFFLAFPTIFFIAITLLGWHLMPNGIWGLYTLTDGALAAWNSTSILEWSDPFDPSPYNFFQGLGSLYIPNTPWLNPGALVLSLHGPQHIRYYLSYLVYLIELIVSMLVLGRALGLPLYQSSIAAQLLCLVIFPPYTTYFFTLAWISLAPFNAHLMATLNLALAAFTFLGESPSLRRNLLLATVYPLLLVAAFYSAELTVLTYLPAYALFTVVVATFDPGRRSRMWKLSMSVFLVAAALILRLPAFYRGIAEVTSGHLRTSLRPPADMGSAWWSALNHFDWCSHPQVFLCSRFPIVVFHIAGLLGAIALVVMSKGPHRRFGIALLAYIAFVHTYAVAAHVQLLGALNRLNKDFLVFSSYTFYAFAAVAGAFAVGRSLHSRLASFGALLARRLPARAASGLAAFTVPALLLISVATIPAYAAWFVSNRKSGEIRDLLRRQALPASIVNLPRSNPVTETLIREASIQPGDPFRGFTATFFAGRGSPLRRLFGVPDAAASSPWLYVDARVYFLARYGTSFMMADLWRHNVPTLNEYSQQVTKPLYVFTRELLASPGDGAPGPGVPTWLFSSETNIHQLDIHILKALGVRFLITDSELLDDRVVLRSTFDGGKAPAVRPDTAFESSRGRALLDGEAIAVRLYEIAETNLASYSPTTITFLPTARATIERLRVPAFSPRDEVVLHDTPAIGPLVPLEESVLRVYKGHLRVVARSKTTSLLLLPIQYSRCFSIKSRTASEPLLLRANLVETALVFSGSVDVDLSFDFGPGPRSDCRLADVEDLRRLDFKPWQVP